MKGNLSKLATTIEKEIGKTKKRQKKKRTD